VGLFHAIKGLWWAAATAASYVGAIGWVVGVPLACLALLETLSRLKKPDEAAPALAGTAAPATLRRRTRPLFCAATAAVLMSGNLSLNIAASRVEGHWKVRQAQKVDIYKNHDLAKLVGQCVRLAILRHAQSVGNADAPERKALESIANIAPAKWAELTEPKDGGPPDPRVATLADAKLTQFISEPKAMALHQAEWESMLTEWRTAANADAVSDQTLAAAAHTVAADFGITLREALKADFESGGKAWAAMQLDIAQQLLNRTPVSLEKSNPEINAAFAEVKVLLADNAKAIDTLNTIITNVNQSQEAHAKMVKTNFESVLDGIELVERKVDKANETLAKIDEKTDVALQELGVQKRITGAMLRELANGIQIIDFDPSTKAADSDKFQAILLLSQPTFIGKDQPSRRIELTPEVRQFVERMARNASVIDQHRAAVTLGDFERADKLAEQYEKERHEHRQAEDYAYFVTRGDRFMAASDYATARTWFAQAMALRVDDPAVVYRAARSAILAPGKATYTRDVQLAQSWVERCLKKLDVTAKPSPIDRAKLLATLSTTSWIQGKASEGIAPARESLRVLAAVADTPPADTWFVLRDAAEALLYAGQMSEASAAIDRAMTAATAAGGTNGFAAAFVAASRARIRVSRGDDAGAEADIQKSIDWYEAQSPRDERELAIYYASRATIRQNRGDGAGAETDIKKSIDWFEAQSPRDERGLAIRYASRASIRQDRGDGAGAEADLQKSIDWFEAQSPRDERGLAIRYASRASIRQDRGDLAGAETDIKKSIDWFEAQSPRDERSLAIRYASRASIRQDVAIKARAAGDAAAATAGFKAARADIDAALAWWLANLPNDERGLAILRKTKASIDAAKGTP